MTDHILILPTIFLEFSFPIAMLLPCAALYMCPASNPLALLSHSSKMIVCDITWIGREGKHGRDQHTRTGSDVSLPLPFACGGNCSLPCKLLCPSEPVLFYKNSWPPVPCPTNLSTPSYKLLTPVHYLATCWPLYPALHTVDLWTPLYILLTSGHWPTYYFNCPELRPDG